MFLSIITTVSDSLYVAMCKTEYDREIDTIFMNHQDHNSKFCLNLGLDGITLRYPDNKGQWSYISTIEDLELAISKGLLDLSKFPNISEIFKKNGNTSLTMVTDNSSRNVVFLIKNAKVIGMYLTDSTKIYSFQ